jgi:transcriptional regulator with XRE-family HTH domain
MDWKQTIKDIKTHRGMTQVQIASAVGCAQATISGLELGTTNQPNYTLGVALLKLLPKRAKARHNATQAATENVAEQGA